MKILVPAKRVPDPNSTIKVKPDGSGIVTDPDIPGPSTFKVRFPTPGTYTYACMIHEDMDGVIVVT